MKELNLRLAAIEHELDDLKSRALIVDTLHRYCRAADRCDEELMLSCYHEDAIDDHGFFSGPVTKFVPLVVEELRKLTLSVHSISNPIIARDGERAFVESHYSVIHRLSHLFGFTDFWHHGRYLDIFERRSGSWRIATRVIVQDGERWIQAADLRNLVEGKLNTPPQGVQSLSEDPSITGFNLRTLVKPRPSIPDFWSGFRRLALAPLVLVRFVALLSCLLNRSSAITKGELK